MEWLDRCHTLRWVNLLVLKGAIYKGAELRRFEDTVDSPLVFAC
jgi:hypothetical protein